MSTATTTRPPSLALGEHVERIGRYRLLRAAGGGSSGVVYRAVAEPGGQPVALKLMRALPTDPSARRRFDAETRILRTLSHPDIVQVFDAGHWRGRPWIAMQWLPGHDLTRYAAASRLLPEVLVAEIGFRLASALAHAHEHGVLHRDLKPGNVRVHLPHGHIKLADFGAARLHDTSVTPTGVVLGSPAYMAPEVLAGSAPDARSDLYALGVVLYELLAGRRPYAGETMGDWLRQVGAGPPPPLQALRPQLPGPLARCVMRLLEHAPRSRPAQARALATELRALRRALAAASGAAPAVTDAGLAARQT
jgi:serine/threonine-protein kinase